MTAPLNQGQSAAAEAFFAFLFSDEKEFIISGPGGVGKTYLMSVLIDEVMPRYLQACQLLGQEPRYTSVEMTATTNKAAEVLNVATKRPTSTIHSFLNLKPKEDLHTGQVELTKTQNWKVHENLILFIDEASLVDTPLRIAINEGTHNCKIVYVGDHCQLAPVTEPLSPIYRDNLPFYELTEQMRTKVPEMHNLNLQLRHTVETGEFFPIQIVPGIIDYLDDNQMESTIAQEFGTATPDARILAYTNARVNQFNDHIRDLRQLPAHYTEGESLVSNTAIYTNKTMISVEEELRIVDLPARTTMKEIDKDVSLEVAYCTLARSRGGYIEKVPLPVDREHYQALIKWYQKQKNWNRYFHLKGSYADLRPRDSSTVYKAQGSTYEHSYIDLGNISTCNNPNQVARMLYVAVSRARSRIFLYGNLAQKYGGLIH